MHAGKVFSIKEVFFWTWRETVVFLLIAAVPTFLHQTLGWTFVALPWLPVALVGTAVAFLIGFKNNASYDRLWEARKIWGGIVNDSRTFSIMAIDFVDQDGDESEIHKRLVYRHLAWITALRFQLRVPRVWETIGDPANLEYNKRFRIPERDDDMEESLAPYISKEELRLVMAAPNKATRILADQSHDLRVLNEAGLLTEYRQVELTRVLGHLFDQQGMCERIKNFPYPRQFATINLYFVWIFILLVPLGMLEEFHSYGPNMGWLTIPFSSLVTWVFHTMEKIGDVTESPFQGGANDVPITAISRTIEIDLRAMLHEENLPIPLEPVKNILL
jgi:putative membrane protein